MTTFKFAAVLAAAATLALAPAHVAAQAAGKPVSMGARLQGTPEGAEVVAVLPDRTAAAIGMKVGDIVVEAGGKPISQEWAQEYLKQLKEGDQVSFKVKRAGAVVDLTGKAVAAPEGSPAPAAPPQG